MQYNQLSKIDDYGTQFFDFLFVVIIFTSYNQYVFKFSTPDLFLLILYFFQIIVGFIFQARIFLQFQIVVLLYQLCIPKFKRRKREVKEN